MSKGDAFKARGLLQSAVELDPNFTAAALRLAEANIRTGSFQAATDGLMKIVAKDPSELDAYLLLAEGRQNTRRYQKGDRTLGEDTAKVPGLSETEPDFEYSLPQKQRFDQGRKCFTGSRGQGYGFPAEPHTPGGIGGQEERFSTSRTGVQEGGRTYLGNIGSTDETGRVLPASEQFGPNANASWRIASQKRRTTCPQLIILPNWASWRRTTKGR